MHDNGGCLVSRGASATASSRVFAAYNGAYPSSVPDAGDIYLLRIARLHVDRAIVEQQIHSDAR